MAHLQVLKVLSVVIRRGNVLFVSQPRQHLLHVLQVLVELDGLFQLGASGCCQGLQACQLLIQLSLKGN